MPQQHCLIHVNCQGLPILELLQASPAFHTKYTTSLYINYTKDSVPDAEIRACDLFLYQYLDEGNDWNEFASKTLLAKLKPSAKAVCIPKVFFNGYWPLKEETTVMDFQDIYLEQLCNTPLKPSQILHTYMNTDPSTLFDLKARIEESIGHERNKEDHTPIKTTDFILENWRTTRLFTMTNHPTKPLLHYITNGILSELGLPPLDTKALELDISCDEPNEVLAIPIHPYIAKYFGISFANNNTRYTLFDKQLNFAEYTACYIDCRQRGNISFVDYLQKIPYEQGCEADFLHYLQQIHL